MALIYRALFSLIVTHIPGTQIVNHYITVSVLNFCVTSNLLRHLEGTKSLSAGIRPHILIPPFAHSHNSLHLSSYRNQNSLCFEEKFFLPIRELPRSFASCSLTAAAKDLSFMIYVVLPCI